MSKATEDNKQDKVVETTPVEKIKKPAPEKKSKEKTVKSEKAKADKTKTDKEKAEKAKADKEKAEKAKAEKAKANKEKAEKAKAEKEKADKAKAEKAKADKEKAEKAKVEKAKADKEKAEKAKAEKAKANKEKSEKNKADKAKAENVKAEKTGTEEKNKSKSKKDSEKTSTDKKTTEKKPQGEKKSKIKMLGGLLFAKMMRGGASELKANAEEVNKLNVFPVPDGDTGDNMSMTIQSGVASLENIDTDDLAEVLKVASRGMLLGARGNSGVILSQFFAGMSKGVENVENADAKTLARALEMGVEQAYGSVMTPTEGTILTVARESVEYAVKRLNSKSTVQSLFSDLVNEMNASLKRTPEILPILSEAGVVDSGGAGLFYIIDGLNRVLNGEDVEDVEEGDFADFKKPSAAAALEGGSFGPDSDMEFGYCTELLVQLMNKKIQENPFDLDALKLHLATLGDSIVAFQTETIVKIHVHTLRPDKVMRYMRKFGEFITVKIENMSLQHTELSAEESKKAEPEVALPKKKYGIVAVSNGVGISNLFRELGADCIVEGGQTNNPSTNDFLDAFERINAEHIFVFPNNGNIIMAASQASEIYEKAKVHVVPAKSIGAGYVSLASMNFDSSEPEGLMAEAEDAIGRITSAYISPAVRDADMNGVHVTEGDTMGIINKEIVISGPDKMASTYGLIDIMLSGDDKFMITIFYGKDTTPEERDKLSEYMLATYPLVEAYYVDGGQEIYPFLFVAE